MADTKKKDTKKQEKKSEVAPVQLFSKFGEFNSVEELNEAAAGQLAEGDLDALRELAKENGIEDAEVQDYIDGYTDSLAMPITAAMGRANVEMQSKEKASEYYILKVIYTILMSMLTEETVARAVMGKRKRISAIYDGLRNGASRHKNGKCGCSCGTDRQLEDIIRAYYLDGVDAMEKKIEELY